MAMSLLSYLPSCSCSSSSFPSRSEAWGAMCFGLQNQNTRKLLKLLPKGGLAEGRSRRSSVIVMQAGPGFGKRTESKTKHKVLTLDLSKAKSVETFRILVRKTSLSGNSSKWEKVGDILLESFADVELALKERRKKLNAAVRHQYPLLTLLEPGEDLQYGFKKNSNDPENMNNSINEEVVLVDLKGKEPEISVPAILRADDGTKAQAPISSARK